MGIKGWLGGVLRGREQAMVLDAEINGEPHSFEVISQGKWESVLAVDAADMGAHHETVRSIVGQDQSGFYHGVEYEDPSLPVSWDGPYDTKQDAEKFGTIERCGLFQNDEALETYRQSTDVPDNLDLKKTIWESPWMVAEPGHELQASLGKDEKGYYYAVDQTFPSFESGGEWIGPHKTREEAEEALNARLDKLRGVGDESLGHDANPAWGCEEEELKRAVADRERIAQELAEARDRTQARVVGELSHVDVDELER